MLVGLTKQEALEMLESDDLVGIGMAAHQLRLRKNDPRVVTYQIDRNINYTNFCTEYCSFCAFYSPLGSKDGYILSFEQIYGKIDEMLELGGTGILLQGGLHPDLQIGYYENLLRSLKTRYPQVHLHCFSAPEILCIAEVSEISVRETIQRLMDAGLQSIPGGGAEILDDEVRAKIARLKCTSDDWEEMHRVAHSLGLRTTATMMFGCGEELRHRINHLERLRRIQEDTGGFTAFIPWMFAAENTALGKKVQEATAVDYLKTLAVSRLYLDNFDHIQSSWLTPGIKVCQVGLQFGADDVGSILMDGNVDHHAVRQFDVFQKIKNSAAETRADAARLRLGAGRFGFRSGRFAFFCPGRAGDNALGGIQRFIRKRIGFPVLLAINMIDAEQFEPLRHFLRAFKERLQICALHFILPAHLLHQEFGIALDSQRTNFVRLRIIQRRNEPVILGDIVAHAPDILFQCR